MSVHHTGFNNHDHITGSMGDCDGVTIRARMDNRGRITIKEDDRIALGVNDLKEGERALLEMHTVVIREIGGDSDG